MNSTQASHRILIACGGTGGHLFPGIAVAEELKARGHQPRLLISEKKIDAAASKKYGDLDFLTISAIGTPPLRSPKIIPFTFTLFKSIRESGKIIDEFGAEAVLGMGGFTSLPPIVAASRRKLKAFVHDSNALPGKANRLTARFCDRALIGLEAARTHFAGRNVELTGTPVRRELHTLPDRASAAGKFGLDPDRPTILVMGGSQGAKQLNTLMTEAASSINPAWQILHLTGHADAERVSQLKANDSYHVVPFCDDMAAAYACCDVSICRSGASSLTELAYVGMPSLLIPYPYAADDHQTANARAFVDGGAAELIQERDLDAAKIANFLDKLLAEPELQQKMSEAASSLAVKDAASRIVEVIERSLTK